MAVHKEVKYLLYGTASRRDKDGEWEEFGVTFDYDRENRIVHLGNLHLSFDQVIALSRDVATLKRTLTRLERGK